jgi:thiamine-phosphate pyrophosphorylase
MGAAEVDHPCQIYLAVPGDADPLALEKLLKGDRVSALLLYGVAGPPEAIADEVVALAHAHRIPVLITDAPELVHSAGADGVHIPANEERYAACRRMLGPDAMIGAGCGTSRHDALVLGELGADYVAFGPAPGQSETQDVTELVSWWQEVCEPPVVGWHSGGWDAAAALIDAGADFIGVSALIWEAEGPVAALDRLSSMIAERQRGTT